MFRPIDVSVESRVQIWRYDEETVIKIPAIRKVSSSGPVSYLLLFITLTALFIPAGIAVMMSYIREARAANESPLIGVVVILPWLIVVLWVAWVVLRMGLWRAWGEERITIGPEVMTLQFFADPWKRKADYNREHIRAVYVDIPSWAEQLDTYRQRLTFVKTRNSRVWTYTTLWFPYQGKSVRFGRELNRQEAELIRETINEVIAEQP